MVSDPLEPVQGVGWREAMTDDPGNGDAAIQYLTWAIELIEKEGDEEAASHARAALKRLKVIQRPRSPMR